MKRKGSTDPEAQAFAGAPPSTPVLTPEDVQSKEFRVSRLGGYRMRDVDEFLDHVTDSIGALMAENARLRSRESDEAGAPDADLEGARREAERILRDAREEAARIVADAPGGGASEADSQASPPDPAAVQAFLRREREFLRSLGSLVQEHAEEMKGMAREARRRVEDPATDRSADEVAPAAAPQPADPSATAAMTREDLGVDDEEPVRVSEPEPAASTRTEERRPDGSLRELFWGEDA